MVEVFLGKSLICFLGMCYPALAGETTPLGVFQIEQVILENKRGRYDVLMFAPSDPGYIFAIHRVPAGRRAELLKQKSNALVTDGCINVDSKVYDKLVECCSNSQLIITN